jgi:hypothetical protein
MVHGFLRNLEPYHGKKSPDFNSRKVLTATLLATWRGLIFSFFSKDRRFFLPAKGKNTEILYVYIMTLDK